MAGVVAVASAAGVEGAAAGVRGPGGGGGVGAGAVGGGAGGGGPAATAGVQRSRDSSWCRSAGAPILLQYSCVVWVASLKRGNYQSAAPGLTHKSTVCALLQWM